MGPSDNQNKVAYIYWPNNERSEPVAFDGHTITTVEIGENETEYPRRLIFSNAYEDSFTVRLQPKKMTKKKFKKFLMSRGIQRNKAESICRLVAICKCTYTETFMNYILIRGAGGNNHVN